jgi:hypothetical protein
MLSSEVFPVVFLLGSLSLTRAEFSVQLIILHSITRKYYVKKKGHEIHYYYAIVFTTDLPPFIVQISSSELCSQKSPVYIPPLNQETKFLIHTKHLTKLHFCIF